MMINKFVSWFIQWAVNRTNRFRQLNVTTFRKEFLFKRYCFLWDDEFYANGKLHFALPWWRPFNAFLHHWDPKECVEEFHDHPRWSITIVLRGKIIEKTPWLERELTPGSVVFRSRKFIHAFEVPPGFSGETWTLFIVGRRRHSQNTYKINPEPVDMNEVK